MDKPPRLGQGVRRLTLTDQLPACEIKIAQNLYKIEDVCREKNVIDIGCGFGRNRAIVESVGGSWTGVEPFQGGAHTVTASAEELPFERSTFDVAIMDAVLEHLPNVEKAFSEVARVLRPGGSFVGYVAFMECFHEISYHHLSFKALEHLSEEHGMVLESISGGGRFGIDYHLAVLLYPFPFGWARALIASTIRGFIRTKSVATYAALRIAKGRTHEYAVKWARSYYQLECLRQSNGFQYVIRKLPLQAVEAS